MIRAQAVAARRAEVMDPGFGGATRAAPEGDDVIRRIACLVGEIDTLKRERRATPALHARTALATPYFKKRPDREHDLNIANRVSVEAYQA